MGISNRGIGIGIGWVNAGMGAQQQLQLQKQKHHQRFGGLVFDGLAKIASGSLAKKHQQQRQRQL